MIKIDYIGGNCPVQAEGTIAGKPFYFRARGDHWSIRIGDDPHRYGVNLDFIHDEDYGESPYEAGWMPLEDVWKCLHKAEVLYRLHRKRGTRKHI